MTETFVGMADLVARWTYSRMGAHKITRRPDFPAPAFTINQGRVKVWRLVEVEAFESDRPELVNERTKAQKQWWFGRHMSSGGFQG